jgi:hypothetical protein
MEHAILPVESILERDVDLILLEEFITDHSFCDWFVNELNLPGIFSVNGAWRSISGFGLGETDILFSYNSEDLKIFILIENKLDASFQESQYERYTKRASEYLIKNECDKIFTVLVAPNLYCENQNDFENYISYETIASRFELIGTKRNLFKSELLKIASEKLRRGYQPVNSETVQKFWHSYWHYKEKHHSSFTMKKPGIVPHNSDWPMLYDDELQGITFYHKFGQGNTDANFRGFSNELYFKIKDKLPNGMLLEKHNKSFSIRIKSSKIDRTKEFEDQIEDIKKGLFNLEQIRNWIKENNLLIEI